jgi:hypothetical protein
MTSIQDEHHAEIPVMCGPNLRESNRSKGVVICREPTRCRGQRHALHAGGDRQAAGLEPRAYLHYLFETLPKMTAQDDIDDLLPHRLTPELLKIPAPVL